MADKVRHHGAITPAMQHFYDKHVLYPLRGENPGELIEFYSGIGETAVLSRVGMFGSEQTQRKYDKRRLQGLVRGLLNEWQSPIQKEGEA